MKKVRSKKGFSLSEVLVAVLIMALVTGVVAAGMPTAIDAYHNIVDVANAQLLLTTTTNSLRNELDLARNIQVDSDSTTISFRSSNGTMSRIQFAAGESAKIYEYVGYASEVLRPNAQNTDPTSEGFSRPLVSEATASNSMCVQVESIETDGETLTLKNVTVQKGTKTLASIDEYTIKYIKKPQSNG